jgi:primosomal protein N' (replication factor Y)
VLVAVAVPVPFLGELTYCVPDGMTCPPVGARVRVPLGTRTLTGCVVGCDVPPREGQSAKAIEEILDAEPFLPSSIVDLCRWTAEYYMAGIGDALRIAMPPGARQARGSFKTQRVAMLTAHGLSTITQGPIVEGTLDAIRPLTARQRAALDVLASMPAGSSMATLRERGVTADVVRRLVQRGLVSITHDALERDPFEGLAPPVVDEGPVRTLTGEQDQALAVLRELCDRRRFGVALLHGVTGSGKTELYLRLSADVLQSGRQVLLLVPEIALTPSVAALFRGAFGTRVAIQHSALSDGERHDQWHRIRHGNVDVVIGTRSAVFAPLERLGLVVVDEEHDSSYKQEETPRYHGRDVAIVRAQAAEATVLLGSATPSLESYHNATTGKYVLVALENRVLDRAMAAVRLVAMRDEYAARGPDVVLSLALDEAIGARLAAREQVVVLLNRRGYATSVFCRQCGDTFECPNCSVSLTMHLTRADGGAARDAGGLSPQVAGWGRCHYCNYSLRMPKACRKCAAPYLEQAGFGTERVEAELRARFPEARIGRVDRDSVRRKGALAELLSRFGRGQLDMLVGTQMIAKGHDFPRVTLVGVISADVGLGLADFRAAERTFQLLTQVAGRAGRAEQAGEAIVQTLYPEHYSVQMAVRQDYPVFFAKEMEFRRGMRYPPTLAMVNVVVRGRSFEEAMERGGELTRCVRRHAAAGVEILGPAPAPMGRLRGEHRVQFFLKSPRRADMRRALQSALADTAALRRNVTVDVDPLNVL